MEEIWKQVKGYEGIYDISSFGRVRRWYSKNRAKENPKYLNPKPMKIGYKMIALCRKGIRRPEYIHRLVANAFLVTIKNKLHVNHKDLNKQNNHVNNLEWVNSSENQFHSYKNDKNRKKTPPNWRDRFNLKSRQEKHQIIFDIHSKVLTGITIEKACFENKISSKTYRDWRKRFMKKPQIGDICLYCKFGTPNGEHLPEPSPAIVTKVLNEETQECQLFVMNPNGLYFNPTPYSEELKPGHWSWMPYQKERYAKMYSQADQ